MRSRKKRLVQLMTIAMLSILPWEMEKPFSHHASAASIGEEVFEQSCASCHGVNGNSGYAPDLVGSNFKSSYKNFNDAYSFISRNMPEGAAGSLSIEEYKAVTNYLLEKNGIMESISNGIVIRINGKVQLYDQPPVIQKGRTLVPLRGIFEALGASVQWNGKTKEIQATKGSETVVIKIGSDKAKMNDKIVSLEAKAQIVNGRTLVPLRFVSEALGAEVKWDSGTRAVDIIAR